MVALAAAVDGGGSYTVTRYVGVVCVTPPTVSVPVTCKYRNRVRITLIG